MKLNIQSLKRDVLEVARFATVGVLATLVHSVVTALVFVVTDMALLANLSGFLIAFLVSATGHVLWTFPNTANRRTAVTRFFVVAAFGFTVSNGLLIAGSSLWPEATPLALAVAVGIVPIISFLLSRFWAFRDQI